VCGEVPRGVPLRPQALGSSGREHQAADVVCVRGLVSCRDAAKVTAEQIKGLSSQVVKELLFNGGWQRSCCCRGGGAVVQDVPEAQAAAAEGPAAGDGAAPMQVELV